MATGDRGPLGAVDKNNDEASLPLLFPSSAYSSILLSPFYLLFIFYFRSSLPSASRRWSSLTVFLPCHSLLPRRFAPISVFALRLSQLVSGRGVFPTTSILQHLFCLSFVWYIDYRRLNNMVSRTLMGVWAALNFLLLVAGAVTLALSIVWRGPNLLMNMVLSDADLTGKPSVCVSLRSLFWKSTAGIILAIAFIITCITGIVGVIQRNHITIGLVITNYALLVDAIGIVIIGTFVWFFTLKERHNYSVLWDAATPDVRRALQDQVCFAVTSMKSPLSVM